MSDDLWIIGTAMTPFGRHLDRDVTDLAVDASLGALRDAGTTMADVQVMAVGSQFEPYTFGQQVQKQIGQTGIPLYNVHNACATGATAIRSVIMEIRSGEADIGLALGVEQMSSGSAPYRMSKPSEKGAFAPEGRDGHVLPTEGVLGTGHMWGVFAQTGTDYARQHDGVGFEQFAKVAEKNHAHSTLNPLAQYQREYSLEEIMGAEMMAYPNTLPMCCPTGDGAAAVVIVSGAKLRTLDPDVRRRAVKISAAVMTTDPYTPSGQVHPDVNTLTRLAADQAYERAGVDPADLDLVELHDCFASAELVHYDNLRLCEPGGAGDFIDRRGPWRDGEIPVNVSGGLISKGHPIGATGVANVYEVATHLRGEAGDRQIEDAKVGLTHVIGLGSVCVVHILERSRLVTVGNLSDLRVLDLTIWRPGPYATQLLAEQGADVLKVEPPGGDPMRSMPDLFDILGAHKRSIVLDLKSDEGRARCLELAAEADVFVESYRPGVAERLGVGYEAVSERNPSIVYCSISGFGAFGPLAQVPGHDINYLAYSGVLAPHGTTPREPTVPIGDLGGGIAGAFGIVTAVLGARTHGRGERIDVSVTDVLSTWVGPVGAVKMVGVERPLTGVPGYGAFPTADGQFVAIGIMNEDHFWVGLCRALGLPHEGLSNRDRNARVPRKLNGEIASVLLTLTEAEALERLTAHDVPAAAVLDRAAMLEHPHFRERGVVVDRPDGGATSGPLVRFEERPGLAPYGAPAVAADEPGGWRPR